jgi:hypothetical protein
VGAAGDVYVLRPGDDSDLRIEAPDGATRALLAALDGTRRVHELEGEFGADTVSHALGELTEHHLLRGRRARPAARARALRPPLRYFSDVGAAGVAPSEYQRRLREARVVVLGVARIAGCPVCGGGG